MENIRVVVKHNNEIIVNKITSGEVSAKSILRDLGEDFMDYKLDIDKGFVNFPEVKQFIYIKDDNKLDIRFGFESEMW